MGSDGKKSGILYSQKYESSIRWLTIFGLCLSSRQQPTAAIREHSALKPSTPSLEFLRPPQGQSSFIIRLARVTFIDMKGLSVIMPFQTCVH